MKVSRRIGGGLGDHVSRTVEGEVGGGKEDIARAVGGIARSSEGDVGGREEQITRAVEIE